MYTYIDHTNHVNQKEFTLYWRDANVTPTFKKGKQSDPSNYRQISLTAIPVKILESLIKDKIVNQHGFIKSRSCTTNLIEFFDAVTKISA